MSLKEFVVGIFTRGLRAHVGRKLDAVRDAGRKDAQLVVGAYLDGFESEASDMLALRQRRLIGIEDGRTRRLS